jgi:hypothetical protein
MIVYQRKSKKKKITNKVNLITKFFKYYFFFSFTLFFIFLFIIFNGGYFKFYEERFLDKLHKYSYINYLKIPQIIYYSLSGLFVKIPEININIDYEKKIILQKDRKLALAKGSGSYYNFTEIPAIVNFDNKNYKVNLRLKGDRLGHFSEINKSSYKIKIKNDKTIFGINKFSLMKPRMRNYIHEWIYHELMKEGGVIGLKYEFVKLKINGENKGLYVLEEGFDKILVERNKNRNGPIFSLNEEWSRGLAKKNKPLMFEVYNKGYWKSKENIKLANYALNLLHNFFNNDLESDKIFDQDKWAWFLAATDINFYAHGLREKSVKFYYNPLSSKFEPISFDGHRIVPDYNKKIISWEKNVFYRNSAPSFQLALKCKNEKKQNKHCIDLLPYKLFFDNNGELNNSFFNKYKKNINKITSDEFLDNFFNQRKEKIFNITSKIYGDYFYVDHIKFWGPGLYYFNKKSLYERSKSLKFMISNIPSDIIINQVDNHINIMIWKEEDHEENIFFKNNNLVIRNIFCNSVLDKKNFVFEINQKIIQKNQSVFFTKKNDLKCTSVLFFDEIYKTEFTKNIEILNPNLKTEAGGNFNNFIEYFYIEGKLLKLKNNKTTIDKNIEIPSGYVVTIEPEQKIILINNSIIISESAFNADGGDPLDNKPIEIRGETNNKGGGIFITNTKKNNVFRNIIFKNLSGSIDNLFLNKFIIYGAVNIYKSSITLQNFEFNEISSEDSINIVSSNFLIENGIFINIASDGIDIDSGNGNVNNLLLKNISNDAMDFSESTVNISNVNFVNIADKAVSVGENSKVNMQNLNIFKSFLGIVSKDGSIVSAKNIKNKDVLIPFASYKKKEEYNGPILKLSNVINDYYQTLYYKDKYSKIIIDNIVQNKITKDIYNKIYSN